MYRITIHAASLTLAVKTPENRLSEFIVPETLYKQSDYPFAARTALPIVIRKDHPPVQHENS